MADDGFLDLVRCVVYSPTLAARRTLLAGWPPALFTRTFAGPAGIRRVAGLLEWACSSEPELALWMLGQGADPTPMQSSRCLLMLVAGGTPYEGPAPTLAAEFLRRGADVNREQYPDGRHATPLHACCRRVDDGALPLLRVLLEVPDVSLETSEGPAEILAAQFRNTQGAAQIRKTRARRLRWGELRRAWVSAVVGAGSRRPPPK